MIYYFVAYKFFRDYTKYFFAAHLKAIVLQSFQLLAIVFVILSQPEFHQPGFNGKFSPYLLSFLISALSAIVPATVGEKAPACCGSYFCTTRQSISHGFRVFAVLLASSFYLMSLIVSLLGFYYVIRPKRLERLAGGPEPTETAGK